LIAKPNRKKTKNLKANNLQKINLQKSLETGAFFVFDIFDFLYHF